MRDFVLDKEDAERLAYWITKMFKGIVPTFFALIISQKSMPLFTYPLGLSLIAAAKKDTLFFFIGTLIFAIYSFNIPLIAGAVSIVILRFVFSHIFISEPLSVKQKLKDKFKEKNLFC